MNNTCGGSGWIQITIYPEVGSGKPFTGETRTIACTGCPDCNGEGNVEENNKIKPLDYSELPPEWNPTGNSQGIIEP